MNSTEQRQARRRTSPEERFEDALVRFELALDVLSEIRNDERDDVCAFLRRYEIAQLRGCSAPPLADLITLLERGEHRR